MAQVVLALDDTQENGVLDTSDKILTIDASIQPRKVVLEQGDKLDTSSWPAGGTVEVADWDPTKLQPRTITNLYTKRDPNTGLDVVEIDRHIDKIVVDRLIDTVYLVVYEERGPLLGKVLKDITTNKTWYEYDLRSYYIIRIYFSV